MYDFDKQITRFIDEARKSAYNEAIADIKEKILALLCDLENTPSCIEAEKPEGRPRESGSRLPYKRTRSTMAVYDALKKAGANGLTYYYLEKECVIMNRIPSTSFRAIVRRFLDRKVITRLESDNNRHLRDVRYVLTECLSEEKSDD